MKIASSCFAVIYIIHLLNELITLNKKIYYLPTSAVKNSDRTNNNYRRGYYAKHRLKPNLDAWCFRNPDTSFDWKGWNREKGDDYEDNNDNDELQFAKAEIVDDLEYEVPGPKIPQTTNNFLDEILDETNVPSIKNIDAFYNQYNLVYSKTPKHAYNINDDIIRPEKDTFEPNPDDTLYDMIINQNSQTVTSESKNRFSDIEETLNQIANGDFDDIHRKIDLQAKDMSMAVFLLDTPFDFERDDLLIYLHMQKTGGTTFGRHMTDNLGKCLKIKGYKRRDCERNLTVQSISNGEISLRSPKDVQDPWILSRLSTGWTCGLHADYTELKNCINSKLTSMVGPDRSQSLRKHLVTNLRNPEDRYVSEWRHVYRGATWKQSILNCNNIPFHDRCFYGRCFLDDWKNVSLAEFNTCPYNLASNRQTRMLADLESSGIDCYNNIFPINLESAHYHRSMEKLLKSAKYNLANKVSYFMLLEYQRLSQYLFEKTFGVAFKTSFIKKEKTRADEYLRGDPDSEYGTEKKLTDQEILQIQELNQYDIELYQYATKLFFQRLKFIIRRDRNLS